MSVDKLNAITKDVGGIPVARLLPQAGKRTIGRGVFLITQDHQNLLTIMKDCKLGHIHIVICRHLLGC